jgi:hypothetical protein
VGLGLVATAVIAIGAAAITTALAVAGATAAINRMKQAARGPAMPKPVQPWLDEPLSVPDLMRKPAGPATSIPAPPKGAWAGFLGELASVGKALKGTGKEVAILFGSMLREIGIAIPALGRLAAALRLGAIVAATQSALTGLLAWMGATFVPTMVAFFSGPVGWITLAVAALIAGLVFFREPIMGFFSWVGEAVGNWAGGFLEFFDGAVIKPLINLWEKIKTPVSNLFANIGWLASKGFELLLKIGYDTFIKPWVDLWNFIKKPVADLWNYLSEGSQKAFNVLLAGGYEIFIQPWVDLWNLIKKPVADLWNYLVEGWQIAVNILKAGFDEIFVKPWVNLWNTIKKPVTNTYQDIKNKGEQAFNGLLEWLNKTFIKPWKAFWKLVTEEPKKFQEDVTKFVSDGIDKMKDIWNGFAQWISQPFKAAGELIQNTMNGIQNSIITSINWVVGKINGLIEVSNVVLGKVGMKIDQVPEIKAPGNPLNVNRLQPLPPPGVTTQSPILGAARGGWFGSAQVIQIAEGNDPGGEYAIPSQMMPAAMMAWSQGARGEALITAMRSPATLAPGSSIPGSQGGGRANVTIQLQTGPVVQMPDGSQWISKDDIPEIAASILEAADSLSGGSPARILSGWTS